MNINVSCSGNVTVLRARHTHAKAMHGPCRMEHRVPMDPYYRAVSKKYLETIPAKI